MIVKTPTSNPESIERSILTPESIARKAECKQLP